MTIGHLLLRLVLKIDKYHKLYYMLIKGLVISVVSLTSNVLMVMPYSFNLLLSDHH